MEEITKRTATPPASRPGALALMRPLAGGKTLICGGDHYDIKHEVEAVVRDGVARGGAGRPSGVGGAGGVEKTLYMWFYALFLTVRLGFCIP